MNTMTGSRVAGGQAGRRAGGQGTGAASSGLRATSSSRERLGLAWASGTSKPTPVTPFPTRPHLLILPQQSTNFGCLVETEHSNTWVYGGGHSSSNHHIQNMARGSVRLITRDRRAGRIQEGFLAGCGQDALRSSEGPQQGFILRPKAQ